MDLLSSSTAANRALSADATSPIYPVLNPLQPTPLRPSSSLVFIDSAVADKDFLAANVTAGSEVHFLDPTQDAVTQITNTLLGRHDIASLHIVSHGEAGGLDFASGRLNLSDLPEFASQIQSWKSALTDDADVLLYGCDVAQGEVGKAFVQILGQLTGADVAASDNLTGNRALGGDWTLEYQFGSIEAAQAFIQPAEAAYQGVLATFTVTNTSDSGTGSLRQAILDANASAGADTITFTGPTFVDSNPDVIRLASELFVNGDLTIQGTGINNLTISGDANNNGSNDAGDVRVFFVNAGTVTLQNLSIANGRAQGGDGGGGFGGGGGGAGLGGGLLINDATVTLQNVAFSNNTAIGGAGASGSGNISASGGGGGGIGGAGGSATGYESGYGGVGGSGGNFGGAGGAGNTGGLGGGDGGIGAGGGGGDYAITPDQEHIGPGSGGAGGFGGGGGGGALGYGYVGGKGGVGGGAGGGAGSNPGDGDGVGGGTFGGGWSFAADLDGFDGGGGAGLGGAIFIRSGSLTLNTVDFTGNSATGGAGRIYSGQGKGGAIFVLDSLTNANGNNQGMPTALPTVFASGVTFAGNAATDNVSSTTPTGGIGSNQDNEDVYGTISSPPPTISLSTSTPNISEGNSGNFTISRGTDTNGDLTVNLTTTGSSADLTSGDYTLNVGGTPVTVFNGTLSVVIPNGQTSVTLNMAALQEALSFAEAADTLTLNLTTGTGYTIGSNSTAGITIAANGFIVTTTSDSGEGALRQAVLNANAIAGTDTITFQIPGTGVQTINLASALPALTGQTIINGYSQTGASQNTLAVGNNANLEIVLNGSGAGSANGITLNSGAAGSTVQGLVIQNFQVNGIVISSGSNGNTIAGNFIGTDATGTIDQGNTQNGIVLSSSNNVIGGTTAAARNIISGNNGNGIVFFSGSNTVQGNYIGTNAAGTQDLGNSIDGLQIQTVNNLIGGTSAGAGNVISGNDRNGIFS